MKSLPKATSKEELKQIFSDIEKSKEDGIKGILLNYFFYIILISNLFIYFNN